MTRPIQHWNWNAFILMNVSSLVASEVVKIATFSATDEKNLVKMTTFPFQRTPVPHIWIEDDISLNHCPGPRPPVKGHSLFKWAVQNVNSRAQPFKCPEIGPPVSADALVPCGDRATADKMLTTTFHANNVSLAINDFVSPLSIRWRHQKWTMMLRDLTAFWALNPCNVHHEVFLGYSGLSSDKIPS